MRKCEHSLKPLIEQPADLAGAFAYAMCSAAGYLVCEHCGRIGWFTKYRRRLSFLRPDRAEVVKRQADEFRRWSEARK